MDILDEFNFSYSTYDTYKKSQLWFYFMKILKADESDEGIQVYGDAGNVVHNAGEDWWNDHSISFDLYWDKYKIDEKRGIKGHKLNRENYFAMYYKLKEYMNVIEYDKAQTELKIDKEFLGLKFKAFIDLYTEIGSDIIVIYDWKTNSKNTYEMHKPQRLIYSWLIWKIKGIIPLCKWVYLKNLTIHNDWFTVDELLEFEKEILQFKKEIAEKGNDIKNYEAGDWKIPFNKYYTLCREEVERRHDQTEMEVHISIKGHYCFFEGDLNSHLEQGIDNETKFDLPNKFWMQEAVKKKARGFIDVADIGTVHLYNKKFKCFPFGLKNKITKICHDFAEYYKKKMVIFWHDKRDATVLNRMLNVMPEKLNGKILRDYQKDAVYKFFKKGNGIIKIATGGGKTLVAAEIIRQADCRTLWIIDRKELLTQTKNELQKLLGMEIGEISGTTFDVKVVTIATIQSLNSRIKNLQEFFYIINFVCVDEFHKSAAESYQRVFAKIPNAKYKLGLTATPARDDGKAPILFSILGDVIINVSTTDLIEWGYLVKPTIEFHEMPFFAFGKETYPQDYKINIVENEKRNLKILEIIRKNSNKKILILTKLVSHGKELATAINCDHIHGSTNDVKRSQIYSDFCNGKNNVLIGTANIFAEGIDIPNLDIIINASANKGDTKSVQILGRVLRIFKNKNSALYIDFLDSGKHTRSHSNARIKSFQEQGHEVIIK